MKRNFVFVWFWVFSLWCEHYKNIRKLFDLFKIVNVDEKSVVYVSSQSILWVSSFVININWNWGISYPVVPKARQIMIICKKVEKVSVSKWRPFYWFSFHVIVKYHENWKKNPFTKANLNEIWLMCIQNSIFRVSKYANLR